MEDLDKKRKFILLRASGKSLQKIAEEIFVSKRTLVTWSKEFKDEIIVQRQIEEDGLRELNRLDQKNRLEALQEQWTKLKNEANRRNLALLPSHHVFDQFSKFSQLLSSEHGISDTDFVELKPSAEREELHKALFDNFDNPIL